MASKDRISLPLGGMLQAASDTTEHAHRVVNMVRDPEGLWIEAPGVLAYANPGAGAIASMTWFTPRPNIRYLVVEQVSSVVESNIRTIDPNSGIASTVFSRRRLASGDLGSLFLQDDRWLYIISPTDAPVRWNGRQRATVGYPSAVPAPSVAGPDQGFVKFERAGADYTGPTYKFQTKQRGVGTFPDSSDTYWRYGYALVLENDRGQLSPPSALAFASGNNDSTSFGRYVVKLSIPRMPDPVVAVHVLRTTNLHGVDDPALPELRYLTRIPHAAGCDYIDHTPDAELGLPFDPDEVGPTPIGSRCGAFWQGSLWLSDASNGTRLYYSHPGKVEQFPTINYLPVGTAATGPIVALHVVPRGLIVFKPGGIYLVKGDPVSGYKIHTLSERVGCAAPRAIELVPNLGVVFLAPEGPHVVIGSLDDDQPTVVRPIPGIRRTWKRTVGPALQTAVSVYDPEFSEVWFQLPAGGDPAPRQGIVLHTDTLTWSLRDGWPIGCFARARGRTWMGSHDETYTGVYVQTRYLQTGIDGEEITASYTSGNLSTEVAVTIGTAEVGLVGRGSGQTFDVATRNDRGDLVEQTESSRSQRHTQIDLPEWGTAVWGSGTWADYTSTRVPVDLYQASGLQHQIRISASRIALWGIELLVTGGQGSRPIRRE